MNKLIKLNAPHIKNRSEMETLIREIARLKLNQKLLVGGMEAEIQGVRDNYESRLGTLAQILAEKFEAARTWAETHPDEFAERRSIEFLHGTIGFRRNPPKLKLLGRWKGDGATKALRKLSWGEAYIRVKEEINKEQIIADVGAELLSASELRKAGAVVVQEESFYVDAKVSKGESHA